MLHTLILGVLIGWSLAIPLGPINLEMMRRNLTYGFKYGIMVGMGASLADLTYIILLICGALSLLNHPDILRIIGIIGAIILFWFGWKSITAPIVTHNKALKPVSLPHCLFAGYTIAFLSPFSILFWASMASQIAAISLQYSQAIYTIPIGLWLGVISWMTSFNTVLHVTRHKISERGIRWSNTIGGLALWGFAVYGLIHIFI